MTFTSNYSTSILKKRFYNTTIVIPFTNNNFDKMLRLYCKYSKFHYIIVGSVWERKGRRTRKEDRRKPT